MFDSGPVLRNLDFLISAIAFQTLETADWNIGIRGKSGTTQTYFQTIEFNFQFPEIAFSFRAVGCCCCCNHNCPETEC